VEAVRKGYWIVLDELNLAPSEVLEALNRLLDDNQELFIPETQETVVPHPNFLLFATQNPPGIYGGRKVLSRAFRNRFVELHVDDIPDDELTTILELRCKIPPSYCKCMISTLKELQLRRSTSSVFAGKRSFITPRDLFRWADRQPQGYQQLAEEGYMILAERLRTQPEKDVVQEVLETHCKSKIRLDELYSQRTVADLAGMLSGARPASSEALPPISWTAGMRRLFTLVDRCVQHQEPVLLVGETGCGKTTVCQLLSVVLGRRLRIINCHQHTETADFLGGLRPVRGKERTNGELRAALDAYFELTSTYLSEPLVTRVATLRAGAAGETNTQGLVELFEEAEETLLAVAAESGKGDGSAEDGGPDGVMKVEVPEERGAKLIKELARRYTSLFEWQDGPLVQAMQEGELMLIDEVSLADDAVLERLNSVFETGRTLFLAEKGGTGVDVITAHPDFKVFATMNPGGDFGKKELSPALRNRFTEIWVPPLTQREDLLAIVEDGCKDPLLTPFASPMLDFVFWFNAQKAVGRRTLSLRDVLAWVGFMNKALVGSGVTPGEAYVHGACLVLLDGLGIGSGASERSLAELRRHCTTYLLEQMPEGQRASLRLAFEDPSQGQGEPEKEVEPQEAGLLGPTRFGLAPFFIPRGPEPVPSTQYALEAKTTRRNLQRVLRALQLPKAILLEGSPGVGKTSLLTALAAASGHQIARINLSEQTDMMDLLGLDLPVSGGQAGQFAWCDGVFLQAMKAGHWVLLDELNLASQSVLEGLNAVLDHRAQVYIPELDRTFDCPPSFRVFACQNPVSQGGGRKGLPLSFLNRFTKVQLASLDRDDLCYITRSLSPRLAPGLLATMVDFNQRVFTETMEQNLYARLGRPWEFNLRDVFRWCQLVEHAQGDAMRALGLQRGQRGHIEGSAGAEGQVATGYLATAAAHLDLCYLQRLRTPEDRRLLTRTFQRFFHEGQQGQDKLGSDGAGALVIPPAPPGLWDAESKQEKEEEKEVAEVVVVDPTPIFRLTDTVLQVGQAWLPRVGASRQPKHTLEVLHGLLRPLQHLMVCVTRNWPSVLLGPPASGKTSLVRFLAQTTGHTLHEFAMTSAADATDLLGCFEQLDLNRHAQALVEKVERAVEAQVAHVLGQAAADPTAVQACSRLMLQWRAVAQRGDGVSGAAAPDTASHAELEVRRVQERLSLLGAVLHSLTALWGVLAAPVEEELRPEQLARALQEVRAMATAQGGSVGKFEWIDGTLLRALELGQWVLLDNVNFCQVI
jgi:midasin